MRRISVCCPLACLIALAIVGPVAAQAPGKALAAREVSPDEEAVRKTISDYRAAVEKGTLDEVAKFWADDADYVDQSGNVFRFNDLLTHARDARTADEQLPARSFKTQTLAGACDRPRCSARGWARSSVLRSPPRQRS